MSENYITAKGNKIITNESDYFKHFSESSILNDRTSCEKNASIIKAFEIALETRKFEIDLYWKRANYFWLFVAAIFVAWYNVDKSCEENTFISFVIMGVGLAISFCWFCVNRGSKYWQENWESNIEYLSTKLGIPIFKMISYFQGSPLNIRNKYPYSVSKVNQMVNFVVIFFWICLIFHKVYLSTTEQDICCIILAFTIATVIICLLFVGIHFFSKGFVCGHTSKIKEALPTPIFFNK